MNSLITWLVVIAVIVGSHTASFAQQTEHIQRAQSSGQSASCAVDIMDTRNFRLIDYRRMFVSAQAPEPGELVGRWRGVNKGIVKLLGYKQFVKEIKPRGCSLSGENILVHQVSDDLLRCIGWQPKIDRSNGQFKRRGKFAVVGPRGHGSFSHGKTFCYRRGGNRPCDPARLIVDKVVKLDDDHMLGRATIRIGLVHIPVAYFVLERIR